MSLILSSQQVMSNLKQQAIKKTQSPKAKFTKTQSSLNNSLSKVLQQQLDQSVEKRRQQLIKQQSSKKFQSDTKQSSQNNLKINNFSVV